MAQGVYPSRLPKEYQGIEIYSYGTQDPRVVATSGTQGQLYLLMPEGQLLKKLDNGVTTNWQSINDTVRIDTGATINVTVRDSVLISTVASTINLPVAANNHKITIKAVLGATVNPNGTDTIDGATSLTLAAQGYVTLIKNGTNWYRIG